MGGCSGGRRDQARDRAALGTASTMLASTAAHTSAELRHVVEAFTGAVAEMQEGGFLPPRPDVPAPAAGGLAANGAPPVPGARLGRARDGSPAWFVAHPSEPGRYVQVGQVGAPAGAA